MAFRGRAGDVRVGFIAADADFQQGARRTITTLQRMQATARRVGRTMQQGFRNSVIAIGALATAIGFGIRRLTDYSSTLVEVSRSAGLSVEQLENLRALFQGDGIGIAQTDKALQEFNVRIGLAQRGVGQYARSFDELNVAVLNADGTARSQYSILQDVARALRETESQSQAASLSYELFGRAGKELTPILIANGSKLNENAQQAGRFRSLTDRMAEANKELGQAFFELGENIDDLIQNVLSRYSRELTQLINRTNEWIISLKEAGAIARALEDFGAKITEAVGSGVGLLVGGGIGGSVGAKAGLDLMEKNRKRLQDRDTRNVQDEWDRENKDREFKNKTERNKAKNAETYNKMMKTKHGLGGMFARSAFAGGVGAVIGGPLGAAIGVAIGLVVGPMLVEAIVAGLRWFGRYIGIVDDDPYGLNSPPEPWYLNSQERKEYAELHREFILNRGAIEGYDTRVHNSDDRNWQLPGNMGDSLKYTDDDKAEHNRLIERNFQIMERMEAIEFTANNRAREESIAAVQAALAKPAVEAEPEKIVEPVRRPAPPNPYDAVNPIHLRYLRGDPKRLGIERSGSPAFWNLVADARVWRREIAEAITDAINKQRFRFADDQSMASLSPQRGLVPYGADRKRFLDADIASREGADSVVDSFMRLQEMRPVLNEVRSAFETLGRTIVDNFDNASDALRAFAKELLAIGTQRLLINPLADALFGKVDGSGGGGLVGGFFSGFYADGGLAPAGMAVVGERGPELVDFSRPGRIYSNAELRGSLGGGGMSLTINVNSTDGPGVRAAIAESIPAITGASKARVMDDARRPGSFRQSVRGAY